MITNILNRPYPILLNKWKLAIYVSIFISFFLSVFQPFGLQFVDINNKTIILIGYGIVTFLILLIDLFIIPILFKRFFCEENWAIWKQILWLTLIVLTISIGNYGYSIFFSIFQWVGLRGFLIFIAYTLPIAIIPIIVITFITQNVYLKRNLKISAQINEGINEKVSENDSSTLITFNSGVQKYSFRLNEIFILESEGNYVQIYYLKNEQIKTQLVKTIFVLTIFSLSLKQTIMKKKIWIAIVLVLLGGILELTIGNMMSAGDFALDYFAAGDFACGVFAAGKFSVGVFSIGIFSVGIFSLGIFNIGVYALGFFLIGWKKKYPKWNSDVTATA